MTKLIRFEKQSSWFSRKTQGKTAGAEAPGTRDQGTWSGSCRGRHLVCPGLWKVSNFGNLPYPLAAPFQAHIICRSGLSLCPRPGPCHVLNFPEGILLSPCDKGQRDKCCAGPGFPSSTLLQPCFIHNSSGVLQEKTLGWWLPWTPPELVGKYHMYRLGNLQVT